MLLPLTSCLMAWLGGFLKGDGETVVLAFDVIKMMLVKGKELSSISI